jgi:hypothetical protein
MGINVHNIIAVPIIDSQKNSIGVLELFNSSYDNFDSTHTRSQLGRYSRYISLLIYSEELLEVRICCLS